MFVASTKRCRAGPPSLHFSEVPAMTTGVRAAAMASAARSISAAGEACATRTSRKTGIAGRSTGACSTSIGISRNAGPGTPDSAVRTACSTNSGIRSVW